MVESSGRVDPVDRRTQMRTASHHGRSLPTRKGQPPHRGGSLICQPRTASHRWRSLHSNNQRPTPCGWRHFTPPRSTRPRGWSLHTTTLHPLKRTSRGMVHSTNNGLCPLKKLLTPHTTNSLRRNAPHHQKKAPTTDEKNRNSSHSPPEKKRKDQDVTRRTPNKTPDSNPFNTASHRTIHIKKQQP